MIGRTGVETVTEACLLTGVVPKTQAWNTNRRLIRAGQRYRYQGNDFEGKEHKRKLNQFGDTNESADTLAT